MNARQQLLTGVEALVRWDHPTKGRLGPGYFIPLAEELGMISLVGEWVLKQACQQLALWHAQGVPVPRVAVNLAPAQLSEGLASIIAAALQASQIKPEQLEIEITEGALERNNTVKDQLMELRRMGVMLSIDDFGTGYSSLAHIRDLPITCFKIDKAFVDGLPRNAKDAAIIRTIRALGESLGVEVLAEGVESRHQVDALLELGVDVIQGYYFSQPIQAHEMAAWIKQAGVRP